MNSQRCLTCSINSSSMTIQDTRSIILFPDNLANLQKLTSQILEIPLFICKMWFPSFLIIIELTFVIFYPVMTTDIEILPFTTLTLPFRNPRPWLRACAFVDLTKSEIHRCILRFLDKGFVNCFVPLFRNLWIEFWLT
jgi:hypothetical protein